MWLAERVGVGAMTLKMEYNVFCLLSFSGFKTFKTRIRCLYKKYFHVSSYYYLCKGTIET